MLQLSLVWLLIGALIGLLADAAQQQPRLGWLLMMSIGAIAALCGGWLGIWFLGKFFATAMALWIAIAGVVVLPRGIRRRGQ
jgi:uncharacterized membrane protein YeaQ/YmgE (transglycosylase-associated protein family)